MGRDGADASDSHLPAEPTQMHDLAADDECRTDHAVAGQSHIALALLLCEAHASARSLAADEVMTGHPEVAEAEPAPHIICRWRKDTR